MLKDPTFVPLNNVVSRRGTKTCVRVAKIGAPVVTFGEQLIGTVADLGIRIANNRSVRFLPVQARCAEWQCFQDQPLLNSLARVPEMQFYLLSD